MEALPSVNVPLATLMNVRHAPGQELPGGERV